MSHRNKKPELHFMYMFYSNMYVINCIYPKYLYIFCCGEFAFTCLSLLILSQQLLLYPFKSMAGHHNDFAISNSLWVYQASTVRSLPVLPPAISTSLAPLQHRGPRSVLVMVARTRDCSKIQGVLLLCTSAR